jgi:hypothetical protein
LSRNAGGQGALIFDHKSVVVDCGRTRICAVISSNQSAKDESSSCMRLPSLFSGER